MLRLLPSPVFVGLFPDHCWLQTSSGESSHAITSENFGNTDDVLCAFSDMLDAKKNQLARNARLVLTVSDEFAVFIPVPWQDALQQLDELHNYSSILFEKQGIKLNAEWILHTEFATYGGTGMAYALRADWLKKLIEIVVSKNYQLISVMPVSAAAYCEHQHYTKKKKTVLILSENRRLTLLRFDRHGLQAHDVEPIIDSADISGVRLLRRQILSMPDTESLLYWCARPEKSNTPIEFIQLTFPNLTTQYLPHGAWCR
ncbi:hypothetical protein LPB67_07775 [Undibacterium sp. Jales W-56]|uniref:hypothetical protein n=1 Tax=Undibacterium sp. Jales W-56 TaxID=2897325 RepID=UPI0021D1855A|nr:hypothetical protein [Undibacterium sp. Jales W-56]MCU6433676.1 hypothetical protein [Undibacterium sp. Jales W-56]